MKTTRFTIQNHSIYCYKIFGFKPSSKSLGLLKNRSVYRGSVCVILVKFGI
uniref:Uncharacterized protein n=1 Tax=Arundo donax TaxID=35708 RepID=A0A0A9BGK7_ARUDO